TAAAALALLLVAVAAARLWPQPEARVPPAPDLMAMAPAAGEGGMPCLYHVMIIQDVLWAAACMKNDPPDDEADCTLPPDRAAILNRALQDAEDACARSGR